MTTGPIASPRKLIARLRALAPDDQRLKALELFGLDQVYRRESRPDRVSRLWRVLCANLAGRGALSGRGITTGKS